MPVILISGNIPGAETVLGHLLPPGVVLKKPFLFEHLLATVRSFLTPTRREDGREQPPSLGAGVAG